MYMSRVILQVPMSKELKLAAEAVAKDYGFSSLQEIIRVLVKKLSKKELTLEVGEPEEFVQLTPRAKKRYEAMTKDFKTGRNVYEEKDVDEFLKILRS